MDQESPATVNPEARPPARQPFGLIIALLIVILGLLLGAYLHLNSRVNRLETRLVNLSATTSNLPQATIDAIIALQNGEASPQPAQATASSGISIDDDAVMGNLETATLAIIEFSDYNCPFCSRFHEETLPQLIESYVDTGEAVYIYRDYVGVGGNVTLAAASAAECAREQLGDSAYFEIAEALYASQGTKTSGMVKSLAARYPVDEERLETCINEEQYRQEVLADTQAGQAAGARGTPAFIIGLLSDDGHVDGVLVPGAQPFRVFEQVINEQRARLN